MRVILFGATGMIGEGALIECLEDAALESVLAVVRRPTGHVHDKLTELIHDDFTDFSGTAPSLRLSLKYCPDPPYRCMWVLHGAA